MTIQHKKVGTKGLFYVELEGKLVAEMVYTMPADDKMIIEHTEVDDSLAGRGVGGQLVHTAVDYARSHHIKIIPLCTFTKSVINKNKDYQDVLA